MNLIQLIRDITEQSEDEHKAIILKVLNEMSQPVKLQFVPNNCENCNAPLKNGVCPYEDMHEVWENYANI